jgi:hypothetical protein
MLSLQADLLSIPVIRPKVRETTAMGAIYMAGLGVGIWKDKEEILKYWLLDKEYKPTEEAPVKAQEYAQWLRAAERAGVSLSDWARRRLDQHADEELGVEEPPAPSTEDIAMALETVRALRGTDLRKRVREGRKAPWTVE